MTASTFLKRDVAAGVHRHSARPTLNFLSNFHKVRDNAGALTAASASTKMFYDTRALVANASESLDLAGGLNDVTGAVMTLTKVHAIYVKAPSTNTANVIVGGAGANGFQGPFADITDKVTVAPGDEFLITSKVGWNVAAGTGDILKVAVGAADSSYDIVIIGE